MVGKATTDGTMARSHTNLVTPKTRGLVAAVLVAIFASACFVPSVALAQPASVPAASGSASAAPPIQAADEVPSDVNDEFLKPLLETNVTPIDLASALRLAGVQNSQILVAQQRVLEAVALRQLAAAQFLPTLNAGTNFDSHQGNLQQSKGTILSVNRDALYFGAGAYAVAAGTVNI